MKQMVPVYIGYSAKDENLKDELEVSLANLRRNGLIEISDKNPGPGGRVRDHQKAAIAKAKIILLLYSNNFIADDFCYEYEYRQAMQEHDARRIHVVPILLRDFDRTGLGEAAKLQPLPTNRMPVMLWSNRDQAWSEISAAIRNIVQAILLKENTK